MTTILPNPRNPHDSIILPVPGKAYLHHNKVPPKARVYDPHEIKKNKYTTHSTASERTLALPSSEYGDTTVPTTPTARSSVSSVEKPRPKPQEPMERSRVEELGDMITQVDEKPTFEDPDGDLQRKGKVRMKYYKAGFVSFIYGFNAFCLFGSWWFSGYFYVFMPFITWGVLFNLTVCITLLIFLAFRRVKPEKKLPPPDDPESLMLIVPCYNENEEELRGSLDSLVAQRGIDKNKKIIFIICDGRVRGPGMTESTGDCLLNTILTEKTYSERVNGAYLGWDKLPMDVFLQKGYYKGMPYVCIVKLENRGKRDSLILLRSFAYFFNLRDQRPATIFSSPFFGEMASFVLDECGIDNFHSIVGMDADTIFHPDCIWHLLDNMRYKNCYGVCGVVTVDFKTGPWNLWRLMQHGAYTVSQGYQRLQQSMSTHKVNCLPGCCQILLVCEEMCGDETLRELFGYCPKPTDSMLKHLRGSYSEDRNHVTNVLTSRPHVQTRQAIKALAYTDVPTSLKVFLSQRKRWSMGATVNDLHLLTKRGTHWFERIRSFTNIQTWFCNLFIMGSLAGLIHAALHVPWYITVGFLGGVLIPYIYMFTLIFWMPPTRKAKVQYLFGLFLYIITGPFLTVGVQLYTMWHLDQFSWGKTRKVISEDKASSASTSTSTSAPANHQPWSEKPLRSTSPSPSRRPLDEEESIGFGPGFETPPLPRSQRTSDATFFARPPRRPGSLTQETLVGYMSSRDVSRAETPEPGAGGGSVGWGTPRLVERRDMMEAGRPGVVGGVVEGDEKGGER